ncbi:hypothetical protein KHQ88_01105 [Mycoplasmatota bacterium]|nr:hypothetical protein KHQ88_01105 [Mycoplasmatota bacterium]
MEKIKVLSRTKEDYKDLEAYLKKHKMVDDSGIWFAGYDDSTKAVRHSVAANIFTGYKKIMIVSIFGDSIYVLKNSKEGFNVYDFSRVHDKNKFGMRRHLLYPSVEVHAENGQSLYIQVTKNKKMIKAFKKLVK